MQVLSSRWFKLSVSLGLWGFLLYRTDLSLLRERLSSVHPAWVLVGFVGYLLSQVLSAYKWQLLARPLGFLQPFRAYAAYYFAGMYFNLLAPSTVAGDFGRSVLLAAGRERLPLAVQSVVADRVSGLVMLLWVGAIGVLVADPTVLPIQWRVGVCAAAVCAVVGWWLLPYLLERSFHPEHRLRRFVQGFVGPYVRQPRVLLKACGLSLLFHLLQFGLQLLLARALGLEVSVWYLLVCIPLISLLSGLPISFGGLGVRESGYVMFLAMAGIGQERALALGLLWSAIVLGANATGGVALLLSPAARRPLTEAKRTSDE
ncbi:MAG: flippase-like domain-containing protein [Deltaproteobacteria bacterium]|nr:flippase-like domain-containing protein [Deltaproteobacteria bacterium]